MAGIVAETVKPSESSNKNHQSVKNEVKPSEAKTTEVTKEKVEVTKMVIENESQMQKPAQPVMPTNSDKLDPRHLERLMRVGVNDKTPLK